MASRTKVTQVRRRLRLKNMGVKRKKMIAKKGSTPKFPIHQSK